MQDILLSISVMALPILLAVTFHELAHGWVAYRLGDPTAKNAGRLTLNPIKHLDLVGTLVFVVTQMIGWAKPVPVDPRYFSNPRRDLLWVSAAGPAANLVLGAIFALLFRLLTSEYFSLNGYFTLPLVLICQAGVVINIGLAVFNLLPIPPLDGSGILEGLLPTELAIKYQGLRPYGFIILLVLIVSNAVDYIIFPVVRFLARIYLGNL